MFVKILQKVCVLPTIVIFLYSCSLSEKSPVQPRADSLKEAPAELDRISLNTVISTPPSGAIIRVSSVEVRVDTVESYTTIQKAMLMVDGVEVDSDSTGKPWSFWWPSYFWDKTGAVGSDYWDADTIWMWELK